MNGLRYLFTNLMKHQTVQHVLHVFILDLAIHGHHQRIHPTNICTMIKVILH